MKKVTIQDIADALGISRNTVSKAINNADGLASDTREKILQKAAEMGYKQFSYVAALSGSGKSMLTASIEAPQAGGEIALFTASMASIFQSSHFAAPFLDRFRQELAQFGCVLNVHLIDRENLARCTLPNTFVKERCRAVVCIEMFDWNYGGMICGLDLPVLFVDGPHKRAGNSLPADQIYMENTMGITRLVNDMLRRGKRRLGFVGDWEHCQSFYERYTAFRCAMLMAGAPVDEAFCIKATHYEDIITPLGALPELPDLFICGNDFVAGDVMHALRKLGRSVPEDVMLSGFDDAPESRIMTPALTTVHIHAQIMALSAAHLLMTRIKEPGMDYRVLHTETELIYRESTDC